MNKQTILIVEDEQYLSIMLEDLLKMNNYKPITAATGAEALSIIASHCPDMILLDLGLPDMDGMDIITQVRTWSNIPIIVVSGRVQEKEIVLALDSGADDYITKPFGTLELLARIRTAYRHYNYTSLFSTIAQPQIFRIRNLEINFDKRIVKVNEKPVHFTQIEYKILQLLAQNAGKVLSYEQIIQTIWGPYADKNNQILRVNMANIRRKIEQDPTKPEYIFTINGIGYRLIDDTE